MLIVADFTPDHPQCELTRTLIMQKIEDAPNLQLIQAGEGFIVKDHRTGREQMFLFKAACNTETTERHIREWVERKVNKLLNIKPVYDATPVVNPIRDDGTVEQPPKRKRGRPRKYPAKDGMNIEPAQSA